MAIDIFVIPNDQILGTEIKNEPLYVGEISDDEMLFSEEIAHMNRIKLLKFVGPWDNLVFTQKQVKQLQSEVSYLMVHSKIKKTILELLYKAINMALSLPNMSLKFEID